MDTNALEPRPLYGIGTVARLTGLNQETLRIWERRYGLGASHKSATGRRQYTQADLDHLQMVAALVNSGARIGEIANSERKTLELLVRNQGLHNEKSVPSIRPFVVFLGTQLCSWLDEHQGCIANVDARLARFSLAEAQVDNFESLTKIDMLVLECSSLTPAYVRRVHKLVDALHIDHVLVAYQLGSERWVSDLRSRGYVATEFPPDPAFLAFHVERIIAVKAASMGDKNAGDLVATRPRQFDENQLSAAGKLVNALDCECPKHITDLIRALVQFEDYSAACSVENWRDAAIHSCIYTYTSQARWLMEKSLSAVLEERAEEFQKHLQDAKT